MGDLSELLAVNQTQALKFFLENLENETVLGATEAETIYVASILAHYAQMSRNATYSMPSAASLYEILDNFILPGLTPEGSIGMKDPKILEIAGSQTLFLTGFFQDQLKKKHNLRWYTFVGRGFFEKASDQLVGGEKSYLLRRVAEHFPLWTTACSRMSRNLRDKRYLLDL